MFQQTDKVTVAGQSGSGKTEFIKDVIKKLGWQDRVIIFDPNDEYQDFKNRYVPRSEGFPEFNSFMKKIWDKGNITVIVDEAEQFMPNQWSHDDNGVNYCANIIRRGRHRKIGLIACTRAIAELNKNMIRQSRHIVLFHHQEPNELNYLEKIIGKENAESLPNLEPYEFLIYSSGKVQIFNPIKITEDR